MNIDFTKGHGTGNDFVLIADFDGTLDLDEEQIQLICDRHFGIGADQVLIVESSTVADFKYRIFNADGQEVQQCGNGARCFVRFVHDQGLTNQSAIVVETKRGIIHPQLEANGLVTVDMGQPRFAAAEIPFVSESDAAEQALADLAGGGESIEKSFESALNNDEPPVPQKMEQTTITADRGALLRLFSGLRTDNG